MHIVAARLGDDPTTILSTDSHLLPSSDELAAERLAAALAAVAYLSALEGGVASRSRRT